MAKSRYLLPTSIGFFLVIMIALSIPLTTFVLGVTNNVSYFNVTLTISQDTPCNVTSIAVASSTPVESSTASVNVYFNVTDPELDLTYGNMYVNLTYGSTTRQITGCSNYAAWNSGSNLGVQCITSNNLEYYDLAGTWNMTAYCEDGIGSGSNVTTSQDAFTYNVLYAFEITKNPMTFAPATVITQDSPATNNPQILNNTGNGVFNTINITAYDLYDGSTYYLGSGNFTINVSNDQSGQQLFNNTEITITNAVLATALTTGTEDLYMYVDMPGGIGSGQYNSTYAWEIEVRN